MARHRFGFLGVRQPGAALDCIPPSFLSISIFLLLDPPLRNMRSHVLIWEIRARLPRRMGGLQ
jgi:hypothetical protein